MSPDQFFQGNGHVVTGALPAVQNQGTQLLALPGGTLSVLIGLLRGTRPQLTIRNSLSTPLQAVLDTGTGNGASQVTLPPASDNQDYTLTLPSGASQVHLQVFPGRGFAQVVSILVSLDVASTGAQGVPTVGAVAQAFTGGI